MNNKDFFVIHPLNRENKKVPFSMAIGNGEFVHECVPKHSLMGPGELNQIKKKTKLREALSMYGKK